MVAQVEDYAVGLDHVLPNEKLTEISSMGDTHSSQFLGIKSHF